MISGSDRIFPSAVHSSDPFRHGHSEAARDDKQLLRLQKRLARLRLLIIDELGFVPLSKTGAELLFEVFSQRYERGFILVTSNLPFDEWTEIFGSPRSKSDMGSNGEFQRARCSIPNKRARTTDSGCRH